MKLTCVTATFNCISSGNQERLIRCVDSVAKLTIPHEHLIYDGASKDGTVDLLRELEAKTEGVRIVSEPDSGIYNALNKGVRDAKGEWFYVLGCDDYIFAPDKFSDIVDTESPQTQIIIAPVAHDGERYQFHEIEDLKWVFWKHPYCHQGVIAKTDMVRRFGGFDETYRFSADGDLCFKFHEASLHFHYTFTEFTNYAHGGESDVHGCDTFAEVTRFLQTHLRMTDAEALRFRQVGFPPLRTMIPKLVHRDLAFRIGARFMVRRWWRHAIRQLFLRLPKSWRRIAKRLVHRG